MSLTPFHSALNTLSMTLLGGGDAEELIQAGPNSFVVIVEVNNGSKTGTFVQSISSVKAPRLKLIGGTSNLRGRPQPLISPFFASFTIATAECRSCKDWQVIRKLACGHSSK